jgi:hypothetical protein
MTPQFGFPMLLVGVFMFSEPTKHPQAKADQSYSSMTPVPYA